MEVRLRRALIPTILAMIMLLGLYVAQPANVAANTNAGSTSVEVYSGCTAWETVRTRYHCDGDVTIVTHYQERHCPNSGWEVREIYDSFPGCIAI